MYGNVYKLEKLNLFTVALICMHKLYIHTATFHHILYNSCCAVIDCTVGEADGFPYPGSP